MESVLTIISLIFGVIGGGGALMTYILYSKQMKRTKNAEAFAKEVQALQAAVTVLRDQITFQSGQIEALQKALAERETANDKLLEDKHTLEVKNSKNKGAINKAYSCTFCTDAAKCPVLMQRTKNEEEYLRSLTR